MLDALLYTIWAHLLSVPHFPELAADLVRLTGEIAGPWLEGDMRTMVAHLNVADTAARRASRKAAQRLIPFLILCWVVNYLDRNNIGFAALTMNKELSFTAEMYGFGAGIFFFGYFIFEVPSNLILERVGARRWFARIMISWGVIASSFAFVPSISAKEEAKRLLLVCP